ncbi:MAG: T9SS type A sorting domain-containing protein [Bacteroidetes bacterium]|nr:T9SS type A sorting domain-containing protein [Bacteroidota bacterium]
MKISNFLFAVISVSITILMPFFIYAQQMPDYTGQVFPSNHALNMPIDALPVHTNSNNYVASIGANTALHPDFGTSWDDEGTIRPMGIPYNVVGNDQPLVPITFYLYADESDPGPWPIPQNPYIETVFDWRNLENGDRHMLIVDSSSHILYETGGVYGNANGTEWEGGCGAVFNLTSNDLRPETWTSADAAGLPIFPLLIRYDEVERALLTDGLFHHPIRFTAEVTQRAYIWPARHYASSNTSQNRPPMGLRFRLKADVDISGFSPSMQVILRTMKKYGIIVSDNGGNWFFQGTHDDRWDNDEINSLKSLHGSDFEAVDISEWMSRPGFDINSAAVPPAPGTSVMPALNADKPDNFILYQNYPNPFNPRTMISYKLKERSEVALKIFDILGREIAVLVNETKNAGNYTVEWNGENSLGQKAGSGIYFFRLNSNSGFTSSKKMILIK